MPNTNFCFAPGTLTTILDASAGSSGKGKIGSFICEHADSWQFCCNTFMPQAGHWVKLDDGNVYFYQTLNSCAYLHEKYEKMYIGPGCTIELPAFWRELEENNIPRHKVGISPIATILQDIDSSFERGEVDLDGKQLAERHLGTMKSGCFSGDTKVLMADGTYKNIDTIQEGDYVINMKGIPVRVVKLIDQGKRKIAKVKLSSWHKPFWVTPDHKFWIGDTTGLKKLKGLGKVLDRNTLSGDSKFKWQEISDYENSVFLNHRNIKFNTIDQFEIDLSKWNVCGVVAENNITTNNKINTNRFIRSSYGLGYVFGAFLGDGCARVEITGGSEIGKVSFYLHQDEQHVVDKLVNQIIDIFGIKPKISNRDDNSIIIVTIYNKMIAKMLNEFGKREQKHLPHKYYCQDPDYVMGLYDGLVDTDGHITKRSRAISIKNTSEGIIELIYYCHNILGLSFGASYYENSDSDLCSNTKESYNIRTHIMNRQTVDYSMIRLTEYEELDEEMQVWDIEVDCPSHSFIANNCIVHNSTCHGCGAAKARKILRKPNIKLARDIPQLKEFLCDVPGEIMDRLDQGQAGLLEIAQGFQLSYLLPDMYPFCTSRNCTVTAGLDDMMLPTRYVGNVILNIRTYPIRINNKKFIGEDGHHLTWDEIQQGVPHKVEVYNSGPGYSDQEEIDWDQITKFSGSSETIMEMTSVTKLPRRVFTFSQENLKQAIRYNDTGRAVYLSLNFVNYVDHEMTGARGGREKITDKTMNWLKENIKPCCDGSNSAELMFLGTGPLTDDMVVLT